MPTIRRRPALWRHNLASMLALCIAMVAAPGVGPANAQELRGLVMMPDGVTPAAGVVVVLLHTTRTDSIVARAITTDRGRFTLRAPPATPAALRLLRIGFEPMNAGSFTLAAGETRDASFTLQDTRVKLATFDVKANARCQVQPTGAQLVAQLFQQVRTALIATTAPLGGLATARSINYERQQNRSRKLLAPIARSVRNDVTLKPYASIGADSLERIGYRVPDGEGAMYYAPDAEVLLSDLFLSRHCLQLVNGADSLASLIGIGFRPVNTRDNRVDVQGTLWVDRTTSELQYLEYTYTPVPEYLKGEQIGGRVDYARLPNSGWFVSNWFIRLPVLRSTPSVMGAGISVSVPGRIVVSGLQVVGGAVQEIRLRDQVLYVNTGAAQAGSMPGDELFAEEKVPPNALDPLRTGGLSSVRVACGNQMSFEHEGFVSGRVFDESHKLAPDAWVKAQWKEEFSMLGGVIRWRDLQVSTTTSSAGTYQLCGIAVRRTISLFALRTEHQKLRQPTFVRVTEDSPVAQVDLVLVPPPAE